MAPAGAGGEVEAHTPERRLPPASSPFAGWGTFYQIVGSSAGALTGLQFVVVALSAQSRTLRRAEGSILAFGTPTVVHFGAALLVAALMCAPWASLSGPALALTLCGAAGVGYTIVVILRARRQNVYEPVLEDWIWHVAIPGAAYASQIAAALALPEHPVGAPFWIAGTALLLLFAGIHNAWDAAAWIAVAGERDAGAVAPPPPPQPPAAKG